MSDPSSGPIRPRRRVVLIAVLICGLALAIPTAIIVADRSSVVIYNETGAVLPPVVIRACGQQRVFTGLPEQGSVEWELRAQGTESAVQLELASDPPWRWEGCLIRPHGGFRVTIRLWPQGQVEAYPSRSWWRSLID